MVQEYPTSSTLTRRMRQSPVNRQPQFPPQSLAGPFFIHAPLAVPLPQLSCITLPPSSRSPQMCEWGKRICSGGIAEPCSRTRKTGAKCLSIASKRAAGVGGQPGDPKSLPLRRQGAMPPPTWLWPRWPPQQWSRSSKRLSQNARLPGQTPTLPKLDDDWPFSTNPKEPYTASDSILSIVTLLATRNRKFDEPIR